MDLDDIGESGLIRLICEKAATTDPAIRLAIGDDAALTEGLDPLILTSDLLIEDVHFTLASSPSRLLGRKALAVNLSDIAAMAGRPRYALLGLGLPGKTSTDDLDLFLSGLVEMARHYGVSIIGGDTCRASCWTISITLIGEPLNTEAVTRSGAKPGQMIFVSGSLGDSALGLSILQNIPGPLREADLENHPHNWLIMRHLDPIPRIELGQGLAGLAESMIDLSDGLAIDLGHILEESGGLGAEVRTNAIPLSDAFREYFKLEEGNISDEALALAAGGGEDYELLFTADRQKAAQIIALSEQSRIPLTAIGTVRAADQPGIRFVDQQGRTVSVGPSIYEHFGVS